MDPNEILVLTKDDELTDQDFKALHDHPVESEHLLLESLDFDGNVVYLN